MQLAPQPDSFVLTYSGPPSWGSYQDINPVLEKVWLRSGLQLMKLLFPWPSLRSEEFKKLLNAQNIVLPLGSLHVDALSFVGGLREKGFKGRLVLQCAGDAMSGQNYLSSMERIFRPGDILVTNSPAEKTSLESFLKEGARVESIPLPVDTEFFSPRVSRSELRRELGLCSENKYLVYAGRISTQKNILSLLSVFKDFREKFPEWKLRICGGTDEIGVPHMDHQNHIRYLFEVSFWIKRLGLEEHVQFLGPISQERLSEEFAAVDGFASFTLHVSEDFGYALAQALSSGLPSVISRWGGGGFFIDQGFAFGTRTFMTENGPRIAYDEALQNLMYVGQGGVPQGLPRAREVLGVGAIAMAWSELIRSEYIGGGISFKGSSSNKKSLLKNHALNYGALDINEFEGREHYPHPLWIKEENHLFDPISYHRNVSNSMDDSVGKKLGLLLPKILGVGA